MKILVVDQSPVLRAGLRAQLAQMQHEVLEADSGAQALERWRGEPPDLVLIEAQMPAVDGYETVRRMRACAQENPAQAWVPILFLSATQTDADLERAINAGGDDYLIKPVSPVVLAAKIRTLQRLVDMSRALAASNLQLEMLSRQDSLTKLANRRYFDDYLATELRRASRSGEPLSLILVDIDYFALYNEHYGHQRGDECLKRIAGCLQAVCHRAPDVAARYDGKQLALVLPATPPEGALRVANSLAAAIEAFAIPHAASDVGHYVTISQGVASTRADVPSDADLGPEPLIERAELALYRAKGRGRNCAEIAPAAELAH